MSERPSIGRLVSLSRAIEILGGVDTDRRAEIQAELRRAALDFPAKGRRSRKKPDYSAEIAEHNRRIAVGIEALREGARSGCYRIFGRKDPKGVREDLESVLSVERWHPGGSNTLYDRRLHFQLNDGTIRAGPLRFVDVAISDARPSAVTHPEEARRLPGAPDKQGPFLAWWRLKSALVRAAAHKELSRLYLEETGRIISERTIRTALKAEKSAA